MTTVIRELSDNVESGEIKEMFVIARDEYGDLISYIMGQSVERLVHDVERFKLAMMTGMINFSAVPFPEDEDEDEGA